MLIEQDALTPIPLLMVSSADHVNGLDGLTITVTLRKPGAEDWETPAGTVAPLGNGRYEFVPGTGDTDTLGYLCLHAEADGADPQDFDAQIVGFDPNAVLSTFDASADAVTLSVAYDLALSALASAIAGLGSPMQAGAAVQLAANQWLYAPAKAGDAMALQPAVDAILADIVARLQRLGSGTATQLSPMQDGGAHLVLTQGEAYSGDDIRYESDDWEDLTGRRVWISAIYKDGGRAAFEAECVVAAAGEGVQAVQVPIAQAITIAMQTGHRHVQFAVWAAYATKDRVLRRGDVSALDDCIA